MPQTDTRTKLLDVAEELFAEKGITATSLRTIIAKAEVNLAAIHYHFGSKEGLVREVFERRIKPVNTERLQRLEEIERNAAPMSPELEDIIKAFIEPAIRLKFDEPNRSKYILKLVTQLQSDSGELHVHLTDFFEDIAKRFLVAFQKALPDLTMAELFLRFKFMLGTMLMIMAHPPVHEKVLCNSAPMDLDSVLAQLIPFLVAGFNATVTEKIQE